jgi:hypothetical protein
VVAFEVFGPVGKRLKVPASALVAGRPIRRLLVANRGELVVRIARTCRSLGITCLALVTDDQREAWWARQADEAVPLAGSYLDGDAILSAAQAAGADAIHPGYVPGRTVGGVSAGWIGPRPQRCGRSAKAPLVDWRRASDAVLPGRRARPDCWREAARISTCS